MKINPQSYADNFEVPRTFNEAYNHEDDFQCDKWREAIEKELNKMEMLKVLYMIIIWTKLLLIKEKLQSRKCDDQGRVLGKYFRNL